MPIIKIQDTKSAQAEKLGVLITDLSNRLSDFCTTKLQEFGVVTNKFTFKFEFNNSRRNFSKSASRLMSVLKRKLINENPYLETAVAPFISLSDPTSGNLGEILSIRFIRLVIQRSDEQKEEVFNRDLRKVRRYFKKLTYLCQQDRIPLVIECTPGYNTNQTELDANTREVQYYVDAKVRLGIMNPGGQSCIYYPLERTILGSLISDPVSGVHQYLPPELIFNRVPEILKVIKTLSRETAYDYIAYGVQPSEDD